MALIKCEECEGRVSTKADACPHCGAKRGNVFRKGGDAVLDTIGGVALWFLKIALIFVGAYFLAGYLLGELWENIQNLPSEAATGLKSLLPEWLKSGD